MNANAPELLMDAEDTLWLAQFQAAMSVQPADPQYIRRVRAALAAMGYARCERAIDPNALNPQLWG